MTILYVSYWEITYMSYFHTVLKTNLSKAIVNILIKNKFL